MNEDPRASGRTAGLWIARGMHVVLAIALLVSTLQMRWMNCVFIVGILALTLLPSALGRRFQVRIPVDLELFVLAFVFASLFLGEVHGYYERFWWWDVMLHTGSGLLLGLFGFLLVHVLNEDEHVDMHLKPRFVALFAFTFAVACGAVWEIFEFAADSLFGLNMQKSGLVDTMWDLIVDTVGAAVISLLGFAATRRGHASFVERSVDRFIAANPRLFRKRRRTVE